MSAAITIRSSWAIFSIFAWLVPIVTYDVRSYLRSTKLVDPWKKSPEESQSAKKVILWSTGLAVLIALALIAGLATGVALNTQLIDNRMRNIIIGVGMLVAAVALVILSYHLLYQFNGYQSKEESRLSTRTGLTQSNLARRVAFSVLGQFAKVYFILMLFYCGAEAYTIPASMVVGAGVGTAVVFIVDTTNKHVSELKKNRIAGLIFVLIIAACSSALFACGCVYIDRVWGNRDANSLPLGLISGFIWLFLSVGIHFLLYRKAAINSETPCGVDDPVPNANADEESNQASIDKQENDATPRKKCKGPINWLRLFKITSLVIISLLFFFVTIANIGANQETSQINYEFPITERTLYSNMDSGSVCAINDPELRGNGTIMTFDSASAANVANYTIVHCGACAACSIWHNLCLEWTKAKLLFKEGKVCGMAGVFKGATAAEQCEQDVIGWTGECAKCWMIDAMCASKACIWIGLQSAFIDTLSNEEVAPGAVTAATCEEAMCERETLVGPFKGEKGFVPCSGASRRRMGVQSSIPRPADELCSVVEMDWEKYCGPQIAA